MTSYVHTQRPSTACITELRRDYWDCLLMGADLTLNAPMFIPTGGAFSFTGTDGTLIVTHATVREVLYGH